MLQDSSPIVTSATHHVSKAACMFICRTQVLIPKPHRQTKEAEKPGYFKLFLYNLPLQWLPACLHCHHCCQMKGIILVSSLDKLKQCKWWLLLPAVKFVMCSFTRSSLRWAQPPSTRKSMMQTAAPGRRFHCPGTGTNMGEQRAKAPHTPNLVFF